VAVRLYTRRTTDPRFLLRKTLALMSAHLKDLVVKRRSEEGLSVRDVEAMISMARALSGLAAKADADDLARKRQLRNMTPEQIEELERQVESKAHSDAIKEGLDARALREDDLAEDEE